MLLPLLFSASFFALLASSELGIRTILLIPVLISALAILLSVEISAHLVIFFLFSGIAWGLELPGAFLAVTALFIAAWLITLFLEKEPQLFVEPTLFYIFLFLLFLVISILDAPYPNLSYSSLLNYGKLLLFFIVLSNAITDGKFFLRIIGMAVLAVIISALYGIYDLLFNALSGNLLEQGFRMRGLAMDPNITAIHILFAVSLLIYFFFYLKRTWYKVALVAIIIFLCGSLVATLSRSATIGLGVLIFLIAWDFRDRKWPIFFLVVFIIGFIIASPEFFVERIASLKNIYLDPSLRWRARLYQGAIETIGQHPFNGLGLSNFIAFSNKLISRHLVVHNSLLEIFAESGPLAFTAYLFILVSVFKNLTLAKTRFTSQGNEPLALIARSLKMTLIAFGVFSLFYSIQSYFAVWAIFAFAAALRKLATSSAADAAFNWQSQSK